MKSKVNDERFGWFSIEVEVEVEVESVRKLDKVDHRENEKDEDGDDNGVEDEKKESGDEKFEFVEDEFLDHCYHNLDEERGFDCENVHDFHGSIRSYLQPDYNLADYSSDCRGFDQLKLVYL